MQAFVHLREGMRLFYDCPSMSGESFEADNFFKKYQGKTAVIASFPTAPVGPLDRRGRVPGVYLKSKSVNVQFEGEDQIHYGLSLHHFVLLDTTTTVSDAEYSALQRVGDLPHPVLFYPGDTVRKSNDLLQVPRKVQEVKFNDAGIPLYVLAETAESIEKRRADKAAEAIRRREEGTSDPARLLTMLVSSYDFPRTEICEETNLVLLERGAVYALYNESERPSFDSTGEELAFWAQDGISNTYYGSRHGRPYWEWPLETARTLVKEGKGDLILGSRASFLRDEGLALQCTVRVLHPCFSQHRDWVRELTLSTTLPPLEQEKSIAELGRGLLELGEG